MGKTRITAEPGIPRVVVEREFDAPRDLVYRAHVDPDLLSRWLGPHGYQMRVEEFDVRAGGKWRYIHIDTDGNEHAFHGVFHADPTPDGFVLTFEYEGVPGHVVMDTYTFTDTDGRTRSGLDATAERVRSAGGQAEVTVVDALDERAVDAHADAVADQFGGLDISMNVIQHGDVQGKPLVEMSLAEYERVVITANRTNFLTARAAGRHMIRRGSGVILLFGGYGPPTPNLGGLQVAFAAMDTLGRVLAAELGPYGVRVITLQSGGIPESLPKDFPAPARQAGRSPPRPLTDPRRSPHPARRTGSPRTRPVDRTARAPGTPPSSAP